MAELTTDDIIITIADQIKRIDEGKGDFVIYFKSIESTSKLPEGSVAKHLEEAAKDAGYAIVRKGSDRASLQKSGPGVYVA